MSKTSQIQMIGKEFEGDFYEKNKELIHTLRFIWYEKPCLDIISYLHAHQGTPMVVIGVVTNCSERAESHTWLPTMLGIDRINDARDAVEVPLQALRAVWEDEYEESYEECETCFYHGEARLIVGTTEGWTDRVDLILR